MANIKSAIKRAQLAEVRRVRNQAVKSSVRTAVRGVATALTAGDAPAVEESYRKAASVIDKAVTKGVLHKNAASRKKAQLAKQIGSKA